MFELVGKSEVVHFVKGVRSMAEQADSGDRRRRRVKVVVGKRAAHKTARAKKSVRATRASSQRSQNPNQQ